MRFDNVADWLAYQESLNVKSIDLGLERVKAVYQSLQLSPRWRAVITVAGTNGKGSSVAMLASILNAAGYRVGSYTSPHLFRYNERIRINGVEVSDEALCKAFAQVESARGDSALTYFEFGTLAALLIFAQASLDVVVLEVGLGGRLDAVNIIDPDVALITALDIDHADWLGSDRETIAKEKAGIMRAGKPMVTVDPNPPQALRDAAQALSAPTYFINEKFSAQAIDESSWRWQYGDTQPRQYPRPPLAGDFQLRNAAGVVMTLELLKFCLPVDDQAVARGLENTAIPGRFQIIPGTPIRIFDVAHNTQAVKELAVNLQNSVCGHNPESARLSHAVFGILKDKAIVEVARAMGDVIDFWYIAKLDAARAADVDYTVAQMLEAGIPADKISTYPGIEYAYNGAMMKAAAGDCVVVFGSFYTVASVLPLAR